MTLLTSPDAVPTEAVTRIRLDIAYEGTQFNGWSRQPGQRTVQGEIEAALAMIFSRHGPAPTLVVAGRTDAGVHATGQVAHLDLAPAQIASVLRARGNTPVPADAGAGVQRRLNGILGPYSDVVIAGAMLAPPGFNARFSALWRRYEYRITDQLARHDPRRRRFAAALPVSLEVGPMDAAARELVGLHDFAAFCKPREGATTIRMLQDFRWSRDEEGVIVGSVRADAFCHNMVRALVGACVAVGERKLQPDQPARLRDELLRTNKFRVMPARGLTLVEVAYPEGTALAERAARTRARRML
ncbi:MAG: tRNA pseudouridine(38-40) synthase TruA [Microbacteriaceae bacterium]